MRYVLISALLVFPVGMVSGLEVARDGTPAATIVVPAFDKNQTNEEKWTARAAEWLHDYVKKSTGADLVLVTEGEKTTGNVISVGHTRLAADAGITTEGMKWDECRLLVKGNTLFLIGRDTYGPGSRDDLGAKGTCRAVVTFLEDFIGCKWFIPSPQGELVPEMKSITVPDDLDKSSVPVFVYGHGRYLYGVGTPAGLANNFRTAIAAYTAGGHTWPVWVPYKEYFEEHPEYFAMINGKRVGDRWNHLCTSNPEVKEILLREVRKKFDEGYEWVQLAQSDGYKRCQCPDCEALDNYRGWFGDDKTFFFETLRNNPCERIHLLHKAIIDECQKSHPDKKVHLLVYGPTSWPSKKFDRYGDNVVAEVCPHYEDTLPVWKPKVWASTVYVYFWGSYHGAGIGPKYAPDQVAESLRLFRDNNVIGIYYCGGGEDWGLEGPAYYTAGRLMGNPDIDPAECVRDYCTFVYGEAGGTMVRFFDELYKRVKVHKPLAQIGQDFQSAESIYTTLFPPKTIQRLDQLLTQAENQAGSERAKGWLKLTRDGFDYVRINADMFTFYRAYMADRTAPNLFQVKRAVEKWKAHRQKLLDYGNDKTYVRTWYPGWGAVKQFIEEGGQMHSRIGAPVNWDFDKLASRFTQTSAGPARLVVSRANGTVDIDGVINENEWQNAKREEMGQMEGVAAEVKTCIRLLFDNENLYVAFECDEPDAEKFDVAFAGHDGPIWNSECVEIFLDTEATKTQYQHFIAAPRAGAYYDARRGYITDPLNPLMDREDTGWDPSWHYAFKMDTAKKRWTLEAAIPFKSLDIAAPGPGTQWRANFGRERYAGRKSPMLYLWAPNELGTGFCEPLCFGEIRFEQAPEK